MIRRLLDKLKRHQKTPRPHEKAPERAPAEKSKAAAPEKATRAKGKGPASRKKPRPRGKSGTSKKPKAPQPPWDSASFDVPPEEGKIRFHDLDLPDPIMHAIQDLGFRYCTPIQAEILPKTLQGTDATGQAQTGTGKSAAFLITIYAHLLRRPAPDKRRPGTPRVLILAPTRELALQIEKDARDLGKYTGSQILSVYGGMGYDSQRRALESGNIDIIMATPGRLLDFKRQGLIDLSKVEILVIDEADRMLDMGFIPDVRKIVYSTPHKQKRQTLFFSATVTPEVEKLAAQWTRDPVHVEIEPEHVAAESVKQVIYVVTTDQKLPLLVNLILKEDLHRVLVFTNRRDQTTFLADRLTRYGIQCAVLSGDVPQKKRLRTLEAFRNGKVRVLVATDVAARGLHVEGISHVVNYTLPRDPEDYVHRIGRTGRAGATGIAVSFACEADSFYIPPIEEFIGEPLPCVMPQEDFLELPAPTGPPPAKKRPQGSRRKRKPGPRKRGTRSPERRRGAPPGKRRAGNAQRP